MYKSKDPSWVDHLGVDAIGSPSGELVRETMREWSLAKHRKPSPEEICLINSLEPGKCPRCGSERIVRNGHRKDGVGLWKCRSCGLSFNPLTGTVFDGKKIPISEWTEYLLHLFEFHSVATSARDNRNAYTTGRYWLAKVFATLKGCQGGVMLEGKVWLDETYVPVDKCERAMGKDGKAPRGISSNLLAIGAATDGRSLYVVCEWASKPSKKRTLAAFRDHIKPGSTLVHDGDNSHSSLVDALGLKSEVHKTAETKGMPDRANPMDRINDVHSLLKRFLGDHGGYARKDLQGWLDLFWFIWSDPPSRYLKIVRFVQKAVSGANLIRYRAFYKKKDR